MVVTLQRVRQMECMRQHELQCSECMPVLHARMRPAWQMSILRQPAGRLCACLYASHGKLPQQCNVCLQNKEHVALAVKEELTKAMSGFGYEIIQARLPLNMLLRNH